MWTDRARFACGGRCLCKIEVCGREDSKLWGACVRGEPGAARSSGFRKSELYYRTLRWLSPTKLETLLSVALHKCEQTVVVDFAFLSLKEWFNCTESLMMRTACYCGACGLSAITTRPTNMTTQLFCKTLRHAYNFCVSAS